MVVACNVLTRVDSLRPADIPSFPVSSSKAGPFLQQAPTSGPEYYATLNNGKES